MKGQWVMPEVINDDTGADSLTKRLLQAQLQRSRTGDIRLSALLMEALVEIHGLRAELQIYRGIMAKFTGIEPEWLPKNFDPRPRENDPKTDK